MPKDSSSYLNTRTHAPSIKLPHLPSQATPNGLDLAGLNHNGHSQDALSGGPGGSLWPEWPESKVPEDRMISKAKAVKCYRLRPQDFEDLECEETEIVVAGSVTEMYLYNEREVERAAWERHGGPDEFYAYLEKLRQRHVKKHGKHVPFVTPETYAERLHNSDLHFGNTYDPDVGHSTELLRIKKKLVPWLWKAFNNALQEHNIYRTDGDYLIGPFLTPESRESPMRRTELVSMSYPPRPLVPLPSSWSVDAVRAILADAASPPDDPNSYGVQIDGLDFFVDGYADDAVQWYEWSAEYLERLFTALIFVIRDHGEDDDGWKSIRWEVYDKYVESMRKYISFDIYAKRWCDPAAEWLEGQFTNEDDTLEKSLRARCPAGQEYNVLLPNNSYRGTRHIGCDRR